MGQTTIGISSRTVRILDYLLRTEEPISTAQVASHFELSISQVRYRLRHLEPWLQARDLELLKRPRVGIRIDASDADREALLAELQQLEGYEIVLDPGERRAMLLLRLLMTPNALPVDELCKWLVVSRTSIFRDLASAREWLEPRGLNLITYRHRGVLVQGPEGLWREAVIELLTSNLSQATLVAICADPDCRRAEREKVGRPFLREFHTLLSSKNLRQAEQLVTSLEELLQKIIVDEGRVRLILYLSLLLRRVTVGKAIPDDDEDSEVWATSPETYAAQEIANKIEGEVDLELSVGEIHCLADKVAEATEAGFTETGHPISIGKKTGGATAELATVLVREAAKYLHAGLLHDQELIDCVALDLSTLPSYWSNSVSLADRLARDVDDPTDPLYGFTCRTLSPVLQRHGHAPTSRLLASIAMHLGTALERLGLHCSRRRAWVICGAGVATARNLVSRLSLHVPELEIVGVASAFELTRDTRLVSGADAVISTIPLGPIGNIPLIHVSPLLTPEDVEELRNALGLNPRGRVGSVRPSPENGLSITEILLPDAIERNVVAGGWEEVVDRAGALLLKVGAIWPSYIEAMKDMIRLYGPYVVVAPGAALLHAGPEMGAKRLAMSLVALREPVPFGHELHDPVDLALAFCSVDHKTHVRAVDEAMKLFSVGNRRQSILAATSNEDILQSVGRIVNQN
jgi:mannitol/fructose-specific phosphotransferase system IIA component (Ntr-type)